MTPTGSPTATPTGSPTASPTASPTPPPQPGDLSGQWEFIDRDNLERNATLLEVDTASGDICLAGRVLGTDPTTTFPRRVLFIYQSLGSIKKADAKKVNGEFEDDDVVLTLTIDEQHPDGLINEFTGQISMGCKLKGALKKGGDTARARLTCDLGENLSAFGLDPLTQQNLIENVTDAFPRRKNVNVNTKTGKLSFNHRGDPKPGDLTIPLSCTPSNGNGVPE